MRHSVFHSTTQPPFNGNLFFWSFLFLCALSFGFWGLACKRNDPSPPTGKGPISSTPTRSVSSVDPTHARRKNMVKLQLIGRDIYEPTVLRAMETVPRHFFVPSHLQEFAYSDRPLPIGHRQTISQPYIVALMAQLANIPARGGKVLEIGTGSGYGAAILGQLAAEVYTIEILPALAQRAKRTIAKLGYKNIHVRMGDGYAGWPEKAPFDAIIVTAAPPKIPEPLKAQLKIGGRLVIPVGAQLQQSLTVLERTSKGYQNRANIPVLFVPMTGKAQHQ